MNNSNQMKQTHVATLETYYGAPSQKGFGSAVFSTPLKVPGELEKIAREKYRYFVGPLWERYGEDAWMGPWKLVYTRGKNTRKEVEAELRSIKDPSAAISVPMILENIEQAEQARAALSAVFDSPDITELQVYNIGDGEAMSGLIIAGQFPKAGEAIILVFLMD